MEWDASVLVLNFIAPHSLGFRPVVLRPDHEIIARNVSPLQEAEVVVDGESVGRLRAATSVRIVAGDAARPPHGARRRAPSTRTSRRSSSTAAMLAELSIDDLVLIAEARLEFCPGLNVITGETGAGKTLLAQAIGLLMGQKGGEELVRPGAARALVQALFESDDETLAVARELPRGGRSRAHHGRPAQLGRAPSRRRCASGSPSTASSSTRACCSSSASSTCSTAPSPAELEPLQAAYGAAYERARGLSRELERLRGAGREREREIDMLRFQVDEIEAAAVEPGEDERLARSASACVTPASCSSASAARSRCSPARARRPRSTACASRSAWSARRRRSTRRSTPPPTRLDGLAAELDDLAGALRAYLDDLDVDPAHRDALELRYDKLKALMRKYGGSADEVLAYAEASRERLALLEEFEADEEQLASRGRGGAAGGAGRRRPSRARRAARLAPDVSRARPGRAARPRHAARHLRDRRHAARRRLGPRLARAAPTRSSSSSAPIPACRRGRCARRPPAASSRARCSPSAASSRSATTSRRSSSTRSTPASAASRPRRSASAWRALAERRQVLCITHLPQVAAYAERQFAIVKQSDAAAGTTETVVRQVDGEERLAELCRMLGAAPDDEAARQPRGGPAGARRPPA